MTENTATEFKRCARCGKTIRNAAGDWVTGYTSSPDHTMCGIHPHQPITTDQTSAEAMAEFEAQGALPAGTLGWWKVWGAKTNAARAGDLILFKNDKTGEIEPLLVVERFEHKAAPMRVGIVTDNGERTSLGALFPIVLMRRGTKNTLA